MPELFNPICFLEEQNEHEKCHCGPLFGSSISFQMVIQPYHVWTIAWFHHPYSVRPIHKSTHTPISPLIAITLDPYELFQWYLSCNEKKESVMNKTNNRGSICRVNCSQQSSMMGKISKELTLRFGMLMISCCCLLCPKLGNSLMAPLPILPLLHMSISSQNSPPSN